MRSLGLVSVRHLHEYHPVTMESPRSLTSMTARPALKTDPDQHQHISPRCLSHHSQETERSQTTQLDSDLARQGLDVLADAVVNTADIGVAKPDPRVHLISANESGPRGPGRRRPRRGRRRSAGLRRRPGGRRRRAGARPARAVEPTGSSRSASWAARPPRQLKADHPAGPPTPATPRTSGGARPAPRCSRPSHAAATLTCSPPSSSSAVSWSSLLPP